ncbi:MAG: GrpB family protein [Planctomycetota bacterium]
MHGLRHGELSFSEYSDQWPQIFSEEKQRIESELGEYCGHIWHIGSTAIPGLMSKPIVDMAMDFSDANQLWHMAEIFEHRLGYRFRNVHHEPNHWYLCRDDDAEVRLFHIHLWLAGSPGLDRHLNFVRIVSSSASLQREYARLKWEWAERTGWDRIEYSEAKSSFVRRVLQAE